MNHANFFSPEELIPESNIVIFSPHYDDVLLGLGGYILGLNASGLRSSKTFRVQLIFSRSNYQVGSGAANYDRNLERIKFATGNRLMEDIACLDQLLGEHNYSYELLREKEAPEMIWIRCYQKRRKFPRLQESAVNVLTQSTCQVEHGTSRAIALCGGSSSTTAVMTSSSRTQSNFLSEMKWI